MILAPVLRELAAAFLEGLGPVSSIVSTWYAAAVLTEMTPAERAECEKEV